MMFGLNVCQGSCPKMEDWYICYWLLDYSRRGCLSVLYANTTGSEILGRYLYY